MIWRLTLRGGVNCFQHKYIMLKSKVMLNKFFDDFTGGQNAVWTYRCLQYLREFWGLQA